MQLLYNDIAGLLLRLEQLLQQLDMWSEQPPEPAALASQQPFCIDTLDFAQWLQYVFVPTLRNTIECGAALPEKCQVAPMAEMQLQLAGNVDAAALVTVLEAIDAALSAPR